MPRRSASKPRWGGNRIKGTQFVRRRSIAEDSLALDFLRLTEEVQEHVIEETVTLRMA